MALCIYQVSLSAYLLPLIVSVHALLILLKYAFVTNDLHLNSKVKETFNLTLGMTVSETTDVMPLKQGNNIWTMLTEVGVLIATVYAPPPCTPPPRAKAPIGTNSMLCTSCDSIWFGVMASKNVAAVDEHGCWY